MNKTLSLDNLEFEGGIDRSKKWMPESMLCTSYLSCYQALPNEVKLRFNQLYAVALCEEIIWFKQEFLASIFNQLLALQYSNDELAETLTLMINEEQKHAEMFWRLLKLADHKRYAERKIQLVPVSYAQTFGAHLCEKYPDWFIFWVLIAFMMGERSLDYSQRYQLDNTLEPNFKKAHGLHQIGASRHLDIHHDLIEKFYRPASGLKKSLAAISFKIILQAFLSPQRIAKSLCFQLVGEFGRSIQNNLDLMVKELPTLRKNTYFINKNYGKFALPRLHQILNEHPELSGAYHLVAQDLSNK